MREYWAELPEYVQVADHVYIDRRLIDGWIMQMVLAWYALPDKLIPRLLIPTDRTSAGNCAAIYNASAKKMTGYRPCNWQFTVSLRGRTRVCGPAQAGPRALASRGTHRRLTPR